MDILIAMLGPLLTVMLGAVLVPAVVGLFRRRRMRREQEWKDFLARHRTGAEEPHPLVRTIWTEHFTAIQRDVVQDLRKSHRCRHPDCAHCADREHQGAIMTELALVRLGFALQEKPAMSRTEALEAVRRSTADSVRKLLKLELQADSGAGNPDAWDEWVRRSWRGGKTR